MLILYYCYYQAKDLTNSLLNNMTSLSSMSLATPPRPALTQGSTMAAFPAPMGPSMGNGFNPALGFQTGGMGMGMRPSGPSLYGGMATTTSTPNFTSLSQPPATRTPDMSALDSLFTPNKPKVSLNQMTPKPPAGNSASPWLNQFGSAAPAQTAPLHQGAPLGMGAAGGNFGMQANPFFSPQNFSQQQQAGVAPGNQIKHSTSANNDLKDLFG